MRALAVGLAAAGVVAAGMLGWWGPQLVRQHAQESADRAVDAATVALLTRCDLVGADATSLAREVAQYARDEGVITPVAARAAVERAARYRPGTAFAVLDPRSQPLAVAGAADGRGPAAAGGLGASCSTPRAPGTAARGTTASAGGAAAAGLGERFEVWVRPRANVGYVVAWAPLDDVTLRPLDAAAGDARLTVLGAGATPRAGHAVPADVRTAVRRGADRGREAGLAFAVTRPDRGLPYAILATSPVRGVALLRATALGVLALGLLGPVALYALAAAQSRRLADQLLMAGDELEQGRKVLADTFSSFGGALEHTHDLEALLDTVVSTCVNAAGAVAGVVMLVEHDGGDQATLLPLGTARTSSPLAERAAQALPALAERFLAWTGRVNQGPLLTHLAGAGPALAVPMSHEGRLVGVLAVARGEGAKAFDALAPLRVREIAVHAGTAVENVRTHEEVRRLSVTDPLTGVGNVRQLSTTLSREVAGALRFDRRLTVLMLDLDHFKSVNDTLGHQFGDVVLREFARRLMNCVREMDTVARYGGEEFAIVLPETDVEGGRRVAERVLAEIRDQPFRQGDTEYRITVSIGVAGFPQHGRSVAEVLQSADTALYAAKRAGRDRWQLAERTPNAPKSKGKGSQASRISQAG